MATNFTGCVFALCSGNANVAPPNPFRRTIDHQDRCHNNAGNSNDTSAPPVPCSQAHVEGGMNQPRQNIPSPSQQEEEIFKKHLAKRIQAQKELIAEKDLELQRLAEENHARKIIVENWEKLLQN